MIEDGAPPGFGRVRRQDGLHEEPRKERANVVGAHPALGRLVERGRDRLGDGRDTAIACAENPDAMLLLGHVHELELLSEDVRDVGQLVGAERRHALRERLACRAAALGAELGRDAPKCVDDRQRLGAGAFGDRVVEYAGQKSDVFEELLHVPARGGMGAGGQAAAR